MFDPDPDGVLARDDVASIVCVATAPDNGALQYFWSANSGSITVNGVSLTVNAVQDRPSDCVVSINLIPHTVQNTALQALRPGTAVNLEIDLIARYAERMLNLGANA